MMWLVGAAFKALRVASNLVIFFEAQRLLGCLIKPISEEHVDRVDQKVLEASSIELRHEYVKCGEYKIRTVFAGNPEDPPLVLIHGHSMSSTFFYKNFADLVDMRYYVIGLDLLGWGRSERPLYTGETLEDSIHFYLESFNEWRKTLHLENFSVIAHSIGAYLAHEFVRTHPGAVNRLMLITPAAIERKLAFLRGLYFTLTPQAVARRLGLLGYLLFEAKFPKEEPYTANSLKDLTWQLNCRPTPSGDIAIKHMIEFESWNKPVVKRPLLDLLERLDMPVHIVSADMDSLVPAETVEKLHHALEQTGTNCTYDVAVGSDHCPFLEVPDQFHGIVAQYFERK
ncbi:hypothetical protein NDN08_003343 [Rhodosorus marinus]|uniref:AB hydrolase-1 domain-containing protein n=1 Tax=Rhodosorus marinus TaxID=101924 RepID=A0AAV8UWC6_9RHOD|nr:hypothetical protein NDN08_003343 [Rhodosorus marinus]